MPQNILSSRAVAQNSPRGKALFPLSLREVHTTAVQSLIGSVGVSELVDLHAFITFDTGKEGVDVRGFGHNTMDNSKGKDRDNVL